MSALTSTPTADPPPGRLTTVRSFLTDSIRANPQGTTVRAAAIVVLLLGIIAIPGFATLNNFKGLLASVSLIGIAAAGMAIITISGNFFMLSMGATTAVSTIVFATTLSLGLLPAIIITVAVGTVVGLLQGLVIGGWGANPIIVTIAAGSILLGAGELWSGGLTVFGDGDPSSLNAVLFDILPVQVLVFFAVVILIHFVIQKSPFGRQIRLIGSNRDTAEFAGLPVKRTVIIGYVIAAACAAMAGVLLGAEAGQGNLGLGAEFDFDVISAVLVGGVVVTGGKGTVLDAAVGAVFIGMVGNLLIVGGQSFALQTVIKGVIVIVAVSAAALLARRKGKR